MSLVNSNLISWSTKYVPKTFSDIISNESITSKLKFLVKNNINTHIILRGKTGSGKKTFVDVYLNYVDPSRENTLWINCSNSKAVELRNTLYLFIDKKIENGKKRYIIINNLERFPSHFYYVLYNLFSNENINVIILETKETLSLDTWCIIFKLHSRTMDDLIKIGRNICLAENMVITDKKLKYLIHRSQNELYPFIHILQSYHMNIKNWIEYTRHTLPYDEILYDPSLIKRIKQIKFVESLGHSLADISINLYNYVYEKDNIDLDIILELGDTIEKYANCEYQKDHLIYSISNIWNKQEYKQ